MALLDDFNRSNNASLGSNWGSWVVFGSSTRAGIVSNELDIPGSAHDYWNVTTYGPDCEVEIDAGNYVTNSITGRLGLRLSTPSTESTNTGYVAQIAASGNWTIYKIAPSASWSVVNSGTFTPVNGDVLKFEAVGDTLTIYQNGVSIGSGTDSTYSSAGYIGMGRWQEGDNFGGGDVASAGDVTGEASLSLTATTTVTGQVGPTETGWDRVELADPPATPDIDTGHSIWVRARKTDAAHHGVIQLKLWDGATQIGPMFETTDLTTSFADYQFDLDPLDVANIADYDNLELEFNGYSAYGFATVYEIADLGIYVPAASTAAAFLDIETSISATGRQDAFGSASLNISVDVDAIGKQDAAGSASMSLNSDIAVDGYQDATGQASLTETVEITPVTGSQTHYSSASLTMTAGRVATGVREITGSATVSSVITLSSSGAHTAIGAASLASTVSTTAVGIRDVFGSSFVPLEVGITVEGIINFVASPTSPLRSANPRIGRFGNDPHGRVNSDPSSDGFRSNPQKVRARSAL